MTEKGGSGERDDSMDCVMFSLDTLGVMTVVDKIAESGSFEALSTVSPGQHHDIAIELMDRGMVIEVVSHLDLFTGVNRQVVKEKLVREGHAEVLIRNVAVFPNLMTQYDVFWLIDQGYAEEVVQNLHVMRTLGYNALIEKLVTVKKGHLVMQYAESFRGLMSVAMMQVLIQSREKIASAK